MFLSVSANIAGFLAGGFGFLFFSFLHLTAGILLCARAMKVKALRQAGLCDSVTLTAEEVALGCKPRYLLEARSWSTGSSLGSGSTPVQLDRTGPEVIPLLSLSLESLYLLLVLTSWSLCC